MNPGPTGPWPRLLPLTVLVAGVHVLLLQGGPDRVAPLREDLRFRIRTVAPPTAAPAVVAVPAVVAAPPAQAIPQAASLSPPMTRPRAAAPAPRRVDPQGQGGTGPPPPAERALVHTRVAVPPPARLHYELTVQSRGTTLTGQALLDWTHDGRDYEARLELTAPGFRGRASSGFGCRRRGGLTNC